MRERGAMGEIKPGADRTVVNGLFLSPPLSPFPSPRLYSRSPQLITPLRDRREHRDSRQGCGPSVHPRWPPWMAMQGAAPIGCYGGLWCDHITPTPSLGTHCLSAGGAGVLGATVPSGAGVGRGGTCHGRGLDGAFCGCQHWFPVSHQPLAQGA